MKEMMFNELSARCSKKQKLLFCEHIQNIYDAKVDKIHSSRNIILGDVHSNDFIVTAHYDTPRRNIINTRFYYDKPRRNNFKRGFINFINNISCFAININNYNDNTSGVLSALEVFETLNSGCILFDNEESGYSGSYALSRKRKTLRDKFFINIDTIGVGDSFVIIYNKNCFEVAKKLSEHFDGYIDIQKASRSRYISDSDFLQNAVTITCMKRDCKGHRYIDDIHSKFDNQINFENIAKVKNMICSFLSSSIIY